MARRRSGGATGPVGVLLAVGLVAILLATGSLDLNDLIRDDPSTSPAATEGGSKGGGGQNTNRKPPRRGPNSIGTEKEYAAARDRLDTIPVKGRAPETGYDRDEFGDSWSDTAGDFPWTGDGCDTRNDLAEMALVDVKFEPDTGDCDVLTGTQPYEPYTGEFNRSFDPSKGTSGRHARDGEHAVPLSWAWQHGAFQWAPEKRAAFANHIYDGTSGHVILVDPGLNRQHSDSGPAAWLPPNKRYRCQYAVLWTNTLADYGLWVNEADHTALARILDRCTA